MNALRTLAFGSILLIAACQSPEPAKDAADSPAKLEASRNFKIRYVTKLEALPKGKMVRLWIPVPKDDPHQSIGKVSVTSPWKHKLTAEKMHGNQTLYFEAKATTAEATIEVSYEVERRFNASKPDPKVDDSAPAEAFAQYLRPRKLVIVNDTIRKNAMTAAKGKATRFEKGRAFYDFVMDQMVYSKKGEGWGRGDSVFACDEKRGNCTDYHSYFMALCMVEKVPSRFQIGLFGKYEKQPAEYAAGGYHCWAEFRAGGAWIPVDISEADKDASRIELLFGGHTPNRVTVSTGRDLILEPKQAGEPLNYLVNPYVEIDGKVHSGASKQVYWTDL